MSQQRNGKVALITGGTSGIGLATALLLARGGAKVALAARGEERGLAAVERVRELGGEAMFVRTDVRSARDVAALVDTVVARWGRLDSAVNSAAAAPRALVPTAELSEDEVDETFAIILKGTWLSLRYQIPAMLRGGGGAIVNVASVNALSGTPMAAAYCAAKHGLVGLTKTAALEYAKARVRVNVVCPGAIRTPTLEDVFRRAVPEDPAHAEEYYTERVPAGRLGEPADAAEAIAWLLSDAANYVTGSVLSIDGGAAAAGG